MHASCRQRSTVLRIRSASMPIWGILLAVGGMSPVHAVDGYKEFKFGMTPAQVKRLCPVPLNPAPNEGWSDAFGKDCQVLLSQEYEFLEKEREVNFVFTAKGLAVVGFLLDPDEFVPVSKTLGEKYPGAKLHPSAEEFQQIAARFDSGQPNCVLKITFDEDSVVLLATRDAAAEATFILLYSDPHASQGREITKKSKDDL
jgi:hypothetical protein